MAGDVQYFRAGHHYLDKKSQIDTIHILRKMQEFPKSDLGISILWWLVKKVSKVK